MSSARRPGTSSRKKPSGSSSSARSSGGGGSSARGPSSSSSSRPAPTTSTSRSSADRVSAFTSSGVTRSGTSSSGGSSGGRSRDVGRSRSGEGLAGSTSKLPPQESLMEIVQKRFVSDVFESAAKAHPGWKILIVDEPGMKVISSAVGMYDIMERQISIVESLDKKRAPFKDMAAVYVLAPTKESVRKLIADYEDKTKVLYGKSIFVFFLGPLSNNLLDEIKGCKQLIKRLKALSEINVDFLIQESRAFTLDVPAPFGSYYLRSSGVSSAEKQVADKLVTLCATLNEYPYIRYKQTSGVCSSLAAIFKVKMDEYVKSNSSWWYHGSGNCPTRNGERDRSTLLLLDRASDCLTPLMHDFTYQAMVHDLLTMEGDKITYQAEKADNPSQKEDKDVLLNEKDHVWVEMRGNHIAQVIEELSGRINEVVNSSTTRVHKGSSSNMSISELASALKDLPEYREVMSKLSQHLHIAHDCMDKFNRAGLLDLADVEQTLATGKDEDGRSPKLTETISRCESALIRLQDPDDRLRLILIATISQNGLSSADRDRLLRAAQLGRSQLQTLESLSRIGINSISNNFSTPTSGTNSFFGSVKSVLSKSDSFDEESEYASSRYSPPLKAILNDLVTNQLSVDEYPSVIPMPMSAASTSAVTGSARRRAKGTEGSLRKSKAGATDKWSKMGNSMTKSATNGGATMFTGGRNMVFMVGGMSYSELRVVRDIMERESREIIAGSTKFVNPSEFLEDLHTLTG